MKNKPAFLFPVIGLVSNAFIWGVMWWPLKQLHAHGWHPLWAITAVFLVATAGLLLFRRNAICDFFAAPNLWIIAIAAGVTNGAFSWGVAIGDVVRVVLLFYLMPVWAVLFARLLLKERVTRLAVVRVGLALVGAGLVLKPDGAGLPVPSGAADWLGVVGGMAFALNNVMIRREAARPRDGRSFAMFLGGVLMPALVALALGSAAVIESPSVVSGYVLMLIVGLGFTVLVANLALQYGASKLPANITAVVMLTEVLFAAVSAFFIDGTTVTSPMISGGALILAASALAALAGRNQPALTPRPAQCTLMGERH